MGQRHGFFHVGALGGVGRAVVEAHHDVRAEGLLDLDGPLGAQEMPRAVDVGLEVDPLLRDPPQGAQAEDLEPAAVGEDGPVPVHEPVKPPVLADQLVPRPQVEVVGVAQDDLGAGLLEPLRRHGLHGSLGPHGHEDGRAHLSVGGCHPPEAGPGVRVCL